jgi:hypothetical protein
MTFLYCRTFEHAYRAVAWQWFGQIRYNIYTEGKDINLLPKPHGTEPFLEAKNLSSTQEISQLSWNVKLECSVHMDPILSQFILILSFTSYILQSRFVWWQGSVCDLVGM